MVTQQQEMFLTFRWFSLGTPLIFSNISLHNVLIRFNLSKRIVPNPHSTTFAISDFKVEIIMFIHMNNIYVGCKFDVLTFVTEEEAIKI